MVEMRARKRDSEAALRQWGHPEARSRHTPKERKPQEDFPQIHTVIDRATPVAIGRLAAARARDCSQARKRRAHPHLRRSIPRFTL
jgi:hypothetical protein